MHLAVVPLLGCCLLTAPAVRGQEPAPERLRPEQIQRSIDKARDWLLKQQKADGSWESMRIQIPYKVGCTALPLLALGNAGVPADNLNMQRALQWLRTQNPTDTYSVSLQTMALAMLALPSASTARLANTCRALTSAPRASDLRIRAKCSFDHSGTP